MILLSFIWHEKGGQFHQKLTAFFCYNKCDSYLLIALRMKPITAITAPPPNASAAAMVCAPIVNLVFFILFPLSVCKDDEVYVIRRLM